MTVISSFQGDKTTTFRCANRTARCTRSRDRVSLRACQNPFDLSNDLEAEQHSRPGAQLGRTSQRGATTTACARQLHPNIVRKPLRISQFSCALISCAWTKCARHGKSRQRGRRPNAEASLQERWQKALRAGLKESALKLPRAALGYVFTAILAIRRPGSRRRNPGQRAWRNLGTDAAFPSSEAKTHSGSKSLG
jgi:hypothetical protein